MRGRVDRRAQRHPQDRRRPAPSAARLQPAAGGIEAAVRDRGVLGAAAAQVATLATRRGKDYRVTAEQLVPECASVPDRSGSRSRRFVRLARTVAPSHTSSSTARFSVAHIRRRDHPSSAACRTRAAVASSIHASPIGPAPRPSTETNSPVPPNARAAPRPELRPRAPSRRPAIHHRHARRRPLTSADERSARCAPRRRLVRGASPPRPSAAGRWPGRLPAPAPGSGHRGSRSTPPRA